MAATKEVVRFGPFQEFFAHAVKVGDTVYLAGQVSLDDEGHVVGAGERPLRFGATNHFGPGVSERAASSPPMWRLECAL